MFWLISHNIILLFEIKIAKKNPIQILFILIKIVVCRSYSHDHTRNIPKQNPKKEKETNKKACP